MSMKAKAISFAEMDAALAYDASTGVIRWKRHYHHKRRVGKVAGTIRRDGYRVIKVNGLFYSAARIAWCLHYGEIDASLTIDHINRNRADNRLVNLRLVPIAVNQTNRGSKYGLPRYCTKHRNRFLVRKDGKYIGVFKTEEEAARAAQELMTPLYRARETQR